VTRNLDVRNAIIYKAWLVVPLLSSLSRRRISDNLFGLAFLAEGIVFIP